VKVEKVRKNHKHCEVGLLIDKDTILLEDGIENKYVANFENTKLFSRPELIKTLWYKEKVGEILKFGGEIRKWRLECPKHFKSKQSWPGHSSEVTVLNNKSCPKNDKDLLEGLVHYRDWIEENGGSIMGTISNTSLSVFKASLQRDYDTPFEGIGITHPIGGRLLPCKSLHTSYKGNFVQWDLISAYSQGLGELRFGGTDSSWRETKNLNWNFDSMVEKGWVIYIEAEVTIPEMRLGPLPERRKTKSIRPLWSVLSFPTKEKIKGVWTYEEIRQADLAGCKIKIIRTIVHHATGEMYWHKNWYHIMKQGKQTLPGFAASLAKETGNSLWGRYAMREKASATVWRTDGGRRIKEERSFTITPGHKCLELADQLGGKIRAKLFRFAIRADNLLLQGNVDSGWIEYESSWKPPSDDWRIKKRANRIDILDDATYRYWNPGEEAPVYITPGIPSIFAEKTFVDIWERYAKA